jgi:hypothetical protein
MKDEGALVLVSFLVLLVVVVLWFVVVTRSRHLYLDT